MSESSSASGSCLCGAVTLTTKQLAGRFAACHCGMCRTWGGGPYLAIDAGAEVEIEGTDSLTIFDSSKWAERGFCKRCGTHLFYRVKEPRLYKVPVGLFGDSIEPSFGLQVFIDRKPESYTFVQQTKELTEAQIWEMYGPAS